MIQTTVESAQSNLPQLLEKVQAGEEIVIEQNGKALARIVAVEEDEETTEYNPNWIGMDKGKIWTEPDFNETPDDMMRAFYGEDGNLVVNKK